jgi:hypothetical protein
VFRYDRRGRGDSGDAPPYAVEREVEDLRAVIDRAGGSAAVLGFSSGAALALTAAVRGLPIARLALYDLPLIADGPLGRGQRTALPAADHGATLAALVAGGHRGDAVEYFQSRVVGIPEPVVAQLRRAPFRPALEAMAHTLAYEAAIVGSGDLPADPTTALAAVRMPVLALAGATVRRSCARPLLHSPPLYPTAAPRSSTARATTWRPMPSLRCSRRSLRVTRLESRDFPRSQPAKATWRSEHAKSERPGSMGSHRSRIATR